MALQRVSTYNTHQFVLGNAMQTQAQLAELQKQTSSGFKTDDFAGLDGQVQQYTDLDQKIARTSRYEENNGIILSRIETTGTALDNIVEIANSLRNLLTLRRSANTSEGLAFQTQIDSAWKALSTQLNATYEGRFLFSGTRTDVQAVNPDSFPSLNEAGVPDDSYYNGSSGDITTRPQDNFELTYNVRGDEQGFQQLVAAMVTAKEGDAANSTQKLDQAYELINGAIENIITVQARNNANKVTVTQINENHQSLRLYWQGVKEEIINTDLVSASTQVAVNQGILQASFQIFARLSSLRLSDFLR